jgi:hypothetical protein
MGVIGWQDYRGRHRDGARDAAGPDAAGPPRTMTPAEDLYMSGIIQQLPALIGVVVGALASYLAGAATERARWRREQSARWDDKRAAAYADYAYAVKNVYVQAMRAAEMRRDSGGEDTAAYEDALAELGKLTDDRTAKWESVLLLGDPETIAAGRAWHRRIWQVERFARGERTDMDQLDSVLEDVNDDRVRFYAAARHDLGITSGAIPYGGPWRPVTEPASASGSSTVSGPLPGSDQIDYSR